LVPFVTARGAKYFLSYSGLEWHPDDVLALDTIAVTVGLGHADVLCNQQMTRLFSYMERTGTGEGLFPATFVVIDPPFGFGLHEKKGSDMVYQADVAWDERAWSADDLVRALTNAMEVGFLSPDHVAFIYLPPQFIGPYKDALQGKLKYGNVSVLYFIKEAWPYMDGAKYNTDKVTHALVAWHGTMSGGNKSHWSFEGG
jgi:hypothetical protein